MTNVYFRMCKIMLVLCSNFSANVCNFYTQNFKTSFHLSQRIFVSPWETHLFYIFTEKIQICAVTFILHSFYVFLLSRKIASQLSKYMNKISYRMVSTISCQLSCYDSNENSNKYICHPSCS